MTTKLEHPNFPRFDRQADLLEAFAQGSLGLTNANVVFQTMATDDWTFDRLATTHRHSRVSVHDRLVAGKYMPSWIPMGQLCSRLEAIDADQIPSSDDPSRMRLYGVVNSRRVSLQSPIQRSFLHNFSQSFSFLWVGLSPGGLHCDYFNNILVQLSGKKRVICFFPKDADAISLKHYVSLPNKNELFAAENLHVCPALREVEYLDITLEAGDAVVLPCAAYHAVKALTTDSVSLNAFFTPQSGRRYLTRHARKEDRWPWGVTNTMIRFSRLSFQVLGVPLLRSGHYEVM